MYTMKDQSLLEAICELYKEGATIREVAQVSGVSVATVGAILKERGLTRNKGCKTRYAFGNRVLPGVGSPPPAKGVVCHACGCKEHLLGARFCCACGAELLSPRDRADQAIGRLLDYFEPYRSTKNMDQVLQDIDTVSAFIRAQEPCSA